MPSIMTVDMENLDTNQITIPSGSASNGSGGAWATNTHEDTNTGAMGTSTAGTNHLFPTPNLGASWFGVVDLKEETSYDHWNWLWFHLESCRVWGPHGTPDITLHNCVGLMQTTGIEPL